MKNISNPSFSRASRLKTEKKNNSSSNYLTPLRLFAYSFHDAKQDFSSYFILFFLFLVFVGYKSMMLFYFEAKQGSISYKLLLPNSQGYKLNCFISFFFFICRKQKTHQHRKRSVTVNLTCPHSPSCLEF